MTADFFSTSHFSRFNSFFLWSFLFPVFGLHWFRRPLDQVIFTCWVSFRLIINQFIWIWSFLRVFELKSMSMKSKSGGLGSHDRVRTRSIRCGASSRKRHGNRHAKPAGLRVPVRPNLRKFLVKCSTSGGFFVNFYTLFFSTTSSILLRKV